MNPASFCILLTLFAQFITNCSQNQKGVNETLERHFEPSVQDMGQFTSHSTLKEVREKLSWGAKMGKMDFKEEKVFNDYYGNPIIMCHVLDKEEKIMSASIYEDKLRMLKISLKHVGDISNNNRENRLKESKRRLGLLVNDGTYSFSNTNYYKSYENGEYWYLTFVLLQDNDSGQQDYYVLQSPSRDYNFLQHSLGILRVAAKRAGKSLTVITHK